MAKFVCVFGLLFVCLVLTTTISRCQDEEDDVEDEGASDAADDVRQEDNVYVLTDSNFDGFVTSHDVVLAEFYAPWCGHCKSLAPEYAKAAAKLKDAPIPIVLAKIDTTVNTGLGERYEIKGYPTLKYKLKADDDDWIDYDGPRDADGIVQYMSEKSDPNYKPPPSAVVTVTNDNFQEFVDSAELVLLEFYAPWCGHCKKLAPEYEKAAKVLIDSNPAIPLGKVDATVEKDLGTKFGVSGYPTLKMFRKGKPYDYNGPREQFGIIEYMNQQSGDAAKLLEEVKDVRAQVEKDQVMVVGFFSSLDAPELASYHEIANERREDLTFGYTLSKEAADRYKVNAGSIVVFTPQKLQTKFEPKYHVLDASGKDAEAIGKHVKKHQVPLVGHYSSMSEKFYNDNDFICLAFYTVDFGFEYRDNTQLWRSKVAEIANEYRDITFAVANEEDYSGMMTEFGLDDSGEEFNFACLKDKKRYPMEPMEEYDADEIKDFLNKLKKGKVAPHIKSQPVPKRKDGPVTVVVGKNFEKVVMDTTKDVLIELYAPWCGHCKQLEPIYKNLAKKLKKEKNLVIAKMDATANDAPSAYSASGFPTIYFASSLNKDNPVQYSGDRTLEAMKSYLEEHATVSFGKNLKDEL